LKSRCRPSPTANGHDQDRGLLAHDRPPEHDRSRPRTLRARRRPSEQRPRLRQQPNGGDEDGLLASAELFPQRADAARLTRVQRPFARGTWFCSRQATRALVDPPNLGVKIPRGQTLAGAFDNGVKTKLSSGEPCDLDVSLLISRKLANHLRIPRLVGTAHRALAHAGTKTMATDFTRKAKHALHGRHSLSLTVRCGRRRPTTRTTRRPSRSPHALGLRYPRPSRGA
jgi:hypothetical protein